MIRPLTLALAALCSLTALPARAQDPVSYELRPGWRMADGRHVAALHLKLAPGWKTYWRAPGDAGIPPRFDFAGSRNVGSVAPTWPTPEVFHQSGMRSIGYDGALVLPMVVTPRGAGDAALQARVEIGICSDICVPFSMDVSGTLPADVTKVDPVIAAALSDRPFSASEAGVRAVRCTVSPVEGGMELHAEIDLPPTGGRETTAVEAGNPHIWVAEPETTRRGGTLSTRTRLMHVDAKPFALDRSKLRITVLGRSHAVDIRGCD